MLSLVAAVVISRSGANIDVRSLFAAVIFGATAIAVTIFASSLVDWYRVLPRMSGVVCPGPCESPGDPRWVKVTNLWLFHRGLATLIVAGIVPVIPGYMLDRSLTGGTQAFWLAVTSIVLIPSGSFATRALTAGYWALNPPLHVGDGIRRHDEYGTRTVWVADVSLQGAKYIELDQDRDYTRKPFAQKSEGLIGLFELGRVRKQAIAPPCRAGRCSGINWYCRNHPHAHD